MAVTLVLDAQNLRENLPLSDPSALHNPFPYSKVRICKFTWLDTIGAAIIFDSM